MPGSPPPPSQGSTSGAPTLTASGLSLGTRLGEFELTGFLGEGGFSVVYAALDHSLERIVAIKEYMPSAIATRSANGTVLPKSARQEEAFKAGLASFISEARMLARFSHPALIHIHRVWEQNGTAYMAMQYCVGQTLRQVKRTQPALVKDELWLKITFAPILDALEILHSQNCFHRDISPDNILILQNDQPILLDFGAARQLTSDTKQALTVILKPGYAPVEQYADDSNLQQGPWTDIYGVGAVLYYLLLGKPPVASVARLIKDPIIKLADVESLADISKAFRQAIDQALAVYPVQRCQSIADFREALQLNRTELNWASKESDSNPGQISHTVPEEKHPTHNGSEVDSTVRMELGSRTGLPSDNTQTPPILHPSNTNENANLNQGTPRPRGASRISWWQITSLGIGTTIVALGAIYGVYSFLHNPATPRRALTIDNPTSDKKTLESSRPIVPVQQPVITPRSTIPVPPPIAGASPPQSQSSASQAQSSPSHQAQSSASQPSSSSLPAASSMSPASDGVQAHPTAIVEGIKNETKTQADPSYDKSTTVSQKILPKPNKIPPPPGRTAPTRTTNPPPKQKPSNSQATVERSAAGTTAPSKKYSIVRLAIRPWGQVSVDGQLRGISPPLTRLSLTPGDHVMIITNSDFPAVTIRFTAPTEGEAVVYHKFETKQ